MDKKLWYACQRDAEDCDWDTGGFDYDEALEMCRKYGCKQIAVINGGWDEEGNATADPICIRIDEIAEEK